MLSDSLPSIGSNNQKSLGDCYNKSADFDKKFRYHWSPQEDSKFLYRQKYVASSKSVPNRNRGLARYRISRSLNFDTTLHSTSSDNSSFEGDKHLSRSAKIMRALNLNNSPTFYGKTKIKKALNFNSTPSPKRFIRTGKSVKKPGNLSLSSSTKLNKVLNYDESPVDSPNSSIVFTSPESMDENQNETPSQRRFKAHTSLTYSTPNPKYSLDSPVSTNFSPLLRSGLKKKIDNIIYIGTPNLQSLRSSKTKLKYDNNISARTPRNLLSDFHDEDDDRPCTPENIITIVPESTSAIKRSHKKERLRLTEKHSDDFKTSNSNSKSRSRSQIWPPDIDSDNLSFQMSTNNTDSISDSLEIQYSKKKCKNRTRASHCSADGNASDTGSIFDYTEECKNLSNESIGISDELMEHDSLNESREIELVGIENLQENENECHDKVDIAALTENSDSFSGEIKELDRSNHEISLEENNVNVNERPVTPEVIQQAATSSQSAVTPENRVNYLQHVIQDSIKRSHRKIKDDNRKRLFSPQVLHRRLDAMTPGKPLYPAGKTDQHENISEDKPLIENHAAETQRSSRSVTPEKKNSSRLLLSQYSSVKKSHRKDKHNKMVSSFKRRQEYFNKDMENVSMGKNKTLSFEGTTDKTLSSVTSNYTSGAKESSMESSSSEVYPCESSSTDKSSPTKRKSPYTSSGSEVFTPQCGSELDDCNSPKEEFQIFTPLKRRKSLLKDTSPITKGYLCVYQVPSGNDDISEEADADLSRCITPVSSYHRELVEPPTSLSSELCNNEPCQELNAVESSPQDTSGRSTPQNMSTTDLYPNIDSIKKSHKKNKRRPQLQKGLLFPMAQSPQKNEEENVLTSNNTMDDSTCEKDINEEEVNLNSDKTNCSMNSDGAANNTQEGTDDVNNPSTSATDDTSTNKTPPACLKTINYIKLLHSTSIKRSHKKERDRKKIELALEKHDLSDDGSIFGDDNDDKQVSSELGDNTASEN